MFATLALSGLLFMNFCILLKLFFITHKVGVIDKAVDRIEWRQRGRKG